MEQKDFEKRLETCYTDIDLARLADEVLKEIMDGMDICIGEKYIARLLECGLDPAIETEEDENDDWICINSLAYIYDDKELKIAKMFFEKCGVPKSFFSFIGSKLDYNYYNVPYVVKLYLLASAYLWETEETYIKMNDNLYEEMFSSYCYTSLEKRYKKLALTPTIFKEIEKYDFSVEMLEQELYKCGKWVIHIFDKESKIEVARYE